MIVHTVSPKDPRIPLSRFNLRGSLRIFGGEVKLKPGQKPSFFKLVPKRISLGACIRSSELYTLSSVS